MNAATDGFLIIMAIILIIMAIATGIDQNRGE